MSSILVFFTYQYWGDNGKYTEDKIEEYDSERMAINDIGCDTWNYAIDNVSSITRVIGGDEGTLARICQGVDAYIAEKQIEHEIGKLRDDLRNAQRFLKNNDEEVLRKQSTVNRCLVRLAELGVE